ncbi:hypothetical protein [uncultured Sphingomonas sp.]|uniref:hypothetical protein n=1 Tax=uncultured Sphingomonas sp. TaxID=158754 RepID=UPI0025E42400|nr:hypothetical protein [uncultured Sphingomonas sp.]
MSELAIGREATRRAGPFDAKVMLLLVAAGAVAFVAALLLAAYAPDLQSGRNGGSHALSKGATGFSGLVRLTEATNRNPAVIRSEDMLVSEDLAVITPDSGRADLSKIVSARGGRTTLFILPKWKTEPDRDRTGWVRARGLLPPADPGATLAPGWPLEVRRHKGQGRPLRAANSVGAAVTSAGDFREPGIVQTISGKRLQPLVTDADGRVVLGVLKGRAMYILAEPDLLNNRGMKDRGGAAAALRLLDDLNSTGADGILFDVTANGLGRSRSPLKLAFDPPFLAVTLTLFAATLLAGWQALVRFGAPRRAERAIAFGKAALVDNSAALVRRAGREVQLGGRYAEVVRQRAAALFRLKAGMAPDEQDRELDRLRPDRPFSPLANAMEQSRSRAELIANARALHRWIKEVDA